MLTARNLLRPPFPNNEPAKLAVNAAEWDCASLRHIRDRVSPRIVCLCCRPNRSGGRSTIHASWTGQRRTGCQSTLAKGPRAGQPAARTQLFEPSLSSRPASCFPCSCRRGKGSTAKHRFRARYSCSGVASCLFPGSLRRPLCAEPVLSDVWQARGVHPGRTGQAK